MHKHTSKIVTFVAGASIGVIAGILFAPTRGSHVRRSLYYQLKKVNKKVQELIIDLTFFKRKNIVTTLAKVASRELVEKTVLKANKLLEEVKLLSAQIENGQEIE